MCITIIINMAAILVPRHVARPVTTPTIGHHRYEVVKIGKLAAMGLRGGGVHGHHTADVQATPLAPVVKRKQAGLRAMLTFSTGGC